MRESLKPIADQVIALGREIERARAKKAPPSLLGNQWGGSSYVDSWKRTRNPSNNELLQELKGTAWACISLNSATCASFPPQLYVVTRKGQDPAKCGTKAISWEKRNKLLDRKQYPHLAHRLKGAEAIEEVTDHPLLDLLSQPNAEAKITSFDLWELTQTYLEVNGRAYWYLERGPFAVENIWLLPAQNVTPKRNPDSPRLVDYYQYRSGKAEDRFAPEDVIAFWTPDPRDPYLGGISPLRAAFEQVNLLSEWQATKNSVYENRGIPSAIVSPDEVIGEEERDRLEAQWGQRFRRGGAGRVLVAESAMRVQLLQQSLGDLAALAEVGATKEAVANAFHVPVAFFTSATNLANLQASTTQHMDQAIAPRLKRRDENLNCQLVPLYDPSGRLFLASEDPVPSDASAVLAEKEHNLKYGVLSINERRGEMGLPAVPWGEVPWLPMQWARTDYDGRADVPAPNVGRNRKPGEGKGNGATEEGAAGADHAEPPAEA